MTSLGVAPVLPGINAQTPGTMPRAEDDEATRASSPEFHDRPGSGRHTADRLKYFQGNGGRMSEPETDSTHLIATLRELIDALDQRVPHVERAGEAKIAREAAELRAVAVKRIEELTRSLPRP